MIEPILLTASGKIRCLRCIARSSRSGLQCGRPALKKSRTQKCQFHGGRSPGPTTAEGKRRIAAARTTHGRDTKAARADRSATSARISRIVDAAFLLGIMKGPKPRGRRAIGYVPVKTLDDIRQMVRDDIRGLCEDSG